MKITSVVIIFVFMIGLLSFDEAVIAPKMKLSEYGFFKTPMQQLQPEQRVFPYEVNAPLFTDYADKARFIYLPEGTAMQYDERQSFVFPEGAVIIKNFFYPVNAAAPEKGRQMVETRLLIREKSGWKALTYLWNETQTDALLEVAGATLPVHWADERQKKHSIEYVVPNVNQCKGCHSYDGQFTPIGTTARQMNRPVNGENQLEHWVKAGFLQVPDGFLLNNAPVLTDYRNPAAPVEAAARAYLDANCAHCHNEHGPGFTSGMFLNIDENRPERLGIGKPPVAAGRGSGKAKYGIVPGKPDQSILYYRMESTDPGVRMPELGRSTTHKEGLALIKTWIEQM